MSHPRDRMRFVPMPAPKTFAACEKGQTAEKTDCTPAKDGDGKSKEGIRKEISSVEKKIKKAGGTPHTPPKSEGELKQRYGESKRQKPFGKAGFKLSRLSETRVINARDQKSSKGHEMAKGVSDALGAKGQIGSFPRDRELHVEAVNKLDKTIEAAIDSGNLTPKESQELTNLQAEAKEDAEAHTGLAQYKVASMASLMMNAFDRLEGKVTQ